MRQRVPFPPLLTEPSRLSAGDPPTTSCTLNCQAGSSAPEAPTLPQHAKGHCATATNVDQTYYSRRARRANGCQTCFCKGKLVNTSMGAWCAQVVQTTKYLTSCPCGLCNCSSSLVKMDETYLSTPQRDGYSTRSNDQTVAYSCVRLRVPGGRRCGLPSGRDCHTLPWCWGGCGGHTSEMAGWASYAT